MSKHKFKRFAVGGMDGIPDQTEEEAANEAALNADLPRRQMADAAAFEGAKDEKSMGVAKPSDSKGMGVAKPSYVSRTPSAPAKKPVVVAASEAPAGNFKLNSLRATKAYMDNQRAKKAANTANSQAIIDRMAKRTKPYMKDEAGNDMKRGGAVKKMASGGSASRRADGCAQRGKTRGKMF